MMRQEIIRRASTAAGTARHRAAAQERKNHLKSRASVVTEAWNDGVAFMRKEQLGGDLSLPTLARRKGSSRRGPSAVGLLRKVFKEADGSGTLHRGFFERSCTVHSEAVIAVGHTILAEQRAAIQRYVKEGGEMCILHWEFDGTPQSVAFQEHASIEALARAASGTPDVQRGRSAARDVLVQRGVFMTERITEDVFAKPLVPGA